MALYTLFLLAPPTSPTTPFGTKTLFISSSYFSNYSFLCQLHNNSSNYCTIIPPTTHYLLQLFLLGSFGNEPMQSCSVHCVSLLLLASASVSVSVLASALASVYSPPSDRFDHRSFISYKYMQLCP